MLRNSQGYFKKNHRNRKPHDEYRVRIQMDSLIYNIFRLCFMFMLMLSKSTKRQRTKGELVRKFVRPLF
jgi:hypothetical protein